MIEVELDVLGPFNADVKAGNVGLGPALNARSRIRFIPAEGSGLKGKLRYWEAGVMRPGHSERFIAPFDGHVDECFQKVAAVVIEGAVTDSLGHEIPISARLDDLVRWWGRLTQSRHLIPTEQTQKHRQAIEKAFKAVTKELTALRQVADRTAARRSEEYERRLAAPAPESQT